METQKASNVPGWAIINLVISIFSFTIILMLFAIMSSGFYKIFPGILGEQLGRTMINGIYRYGFYFALPIGIINLIGAVISKIQATRFHDKNLSRVGITGIVFGTLDTLLGGGLLVAGLFFLTT